MYQRYNAVGITTVGATGLIEIMPGHNAKEICYEIADDGEATIRLYYYDIGLPSLQDSLTPSMNWDI